MMSKSSDTKTLITEGIDLLESTGTHKKAVPVTSADIDLPESSTYHKEPIPVASIDIDLAGSTTHEETVDSGTSYTDIDLVESTTRKEAIPVTATEAENRYSSEFSGDEEALIIRMYNLVGERWSLIAGRIPGRSAEEIEKYWNSRHSTSE